MNHKLVTVARYLSPIEAHLAKNQLELEGIKVFVLDEWVSDVLWHIRPAIGGAKLAVPFEDSNRAREIVNQCSFVGGAAAAGGEIAIGVRDLADAAPTPLLDTEAENERDRPLGIISLLALSPRTLSPREDGVRRGILLTLIGTFEPPLLIFAALTTARLRTAEGKLRPAFLFGAALNTVLLAILILLFAWVTYYMYWGYPGYY